MTETIMTETEDEEQGRHEYWPNPVTAVQWYRRTGLARDSMRGLVH